MLREILRDRVFLLFCFIFTLIYLSYPPTLFFDSGHYMGLADVISSGMWTNWDPIRGIVFPLFLSLSTNILGRNQIALLLPMLFAQLILFLFSVYVVQQAVESKRKSYQRVIIVVVFLFIMLNPVVFGYYHTVLTEFFAATIAIVSFYFAYKIYHFSESLPKISRPLLLSFFYFLLMIPFSWHLKQPYVGAAFFPFFLSCLVIAVRDFRKKRVVLYMIVANFLVVASLGVSIVLWVNFLRLSGMPPRPKRELTTSINQVYESNLSNAFLSQENFVRVSKKIVKNYFALSNLFLIDRDNGGIIIPQVSWTRAFQNKIIASRMYDAYGEDNTMLPHEYIQRTYVQNFSTNYYPPLWFNQIQVTREKESYFLFTLTNSLVTPVAFFLSAILYLFRWKNPTLFIVIVGSGSSFLNAVGHAWFSVIDRYLFWGYPLNLIVLIILLIMLIEKSLNILKAKQSNFRFIR